MEGGVLLARWAGVVGVGVGGGGGRGQRRDLIVKVNLSFYQCITSNACICSVCACVRACVRACVCVCVCVCV